MRGLGTLAGLLCAVVAVIVGLVPPLPAAAAPYGPYADRITGQVLRTSPTAVTASGPTTLTVTARYTNTGDDPIDGLSYRFQRGNVLTGADAIRAEAADPGQPTAVIGTEFTPLPGVLAPGESVNWAARVPLTGGADSLRLTASGVYPLMININGTVHTDVGDIEARVGELHLLLTVLSIPGATGGAGGGDTGTSATALPTQLLWPLVDRPHLGVGGVFTDDSLADALGPDGRLTRLLDALTGPRELAAGRGLVTLVVDPMLLDELDRMSRGYRVLAHPDRPGPPLTPDLVASGERPGTVPGAGADAARDFLDRLRRVAVDRPVLALPYGDPDVVALTRAGMTSSIARAVYRGRATAARLLGTDGLVTTVALPPGGLVDDATLDVLAGLGYESVVLTRAAAGAADPAVIAGGRSLVQIPLAEHAPMPALLDGGGFTDGLSGRLTGLVDADAPTPLDPARMLLALAAEQLTADGRAAAAEAPLLLAPPLRMRADRAGTATLARTLTDFTRAGLVRPAGLTEMTAGAAGPVLDGGPDYPADARRAELPRAQTGTVRALDEKLTTIGRSLAADPAGGANPADLLGPLGDALLGTVSAAHRGRNDTADPVATAVSDSIDALIAGVTVVRSGGSYTLASANAPLLLTVRSTLPYRVTVRLEILGGARAGLTTVDPGPITLDPGPRTAAVRIESTVSRSGTFTVSVRLTAPTGADWGDPVPVTIDSRAYGALTLILMVVTGGLLLVMVALRLRQRWRERGKAS